MKIRPPGGIFCVIGLLVSTASLSLGGCVSASLEDAAPVAAVRTPSITPVPRPAQETVPNEVSQTAPASSTGLRNTGAFPDINTAPQSAGTPIDASQKEALTRDLTAARERLAGTTPSSTAEAEAMRLRLLARTHAERQLEEIEKGE